jgi:UDP-2,4-diacetamido-2,4,6-trideoxy-beta-L-altropyranose hydrolase
MSKSEKRILFRADGSAEIGLGHQVRSLALANMLRKEFECLLCASQVSELIIAMAASYDIKIITLKQTNHWSEFLEILCEGDIVVLDNYFFNSSHQLDIKVKKCSLVTLDDLNQFYFYADVVINHSPLAKAGEYLKEEYTKVFTGLDYVLLRKVFFQNKYVGGPQSKKNPIVICFGGSDYHNISLKVAQNLISMGIKNELYLIIGSANIHYEQLRSLEIEHKQVKVFSNLLEDSVAELLLNSSLLIAPASGILLEAIALGVPFLSGYYAENQIGLASFFLENDEAIIGNFISENITNSDINKAMLNRNRGSLIDGKSPERLLKVFKSL